MKLSFLDKCKSEKGKRIITFIGPFVLLVYLLIGISAYINWFPGSAKFFYASSTSGIIFRIFSTILIVAYSLMVLFINDQKIKIKWVIVFGLLLVMCLVSIFVGEHHFYFTYKTSLYGFLTSKEITVGYRTLLSMYLSSFSDFACAYCFIFALPFCLKDKKSVLILTISVVIFMIAQCGYSLLFERAKYVAMLTKGSDAFSGYNVVIGAMFGDKQEFGAFLAVGFACSVFSLYLIDFKKAFFIVLKIICILSLPLFFAISLLSGCKTATLSEIFICIFCLIGFLIKWFRINKKKFYISSAISAFVLLIFILFVSIPAFHSSGLTEKMYNLFINRFISKIFGSIDSRNFLSLAFFENTTPSVLFLGLSKGAVQTYMQGIILDGQSSIHTGFTYFFASYGLFGFVIYALLLFKVLKNIFKVARINSPVGFMLLGLFFATLIFNISECEILLISSSAAIFVFNILVVSYPKSLLIFDYDAKLKNREREYIVCEI